MGCTAWSGCLPCHRLAIAAHDAEKGCKMGGPGQRSDRRSTPALQDKPVRDSPAIVVLLCAQTPVGANGLLCPWRHHRKPVGFRAKVGCSACHRNLAAKRLNRIVSCVRPKSSEQHRPGRAHRAALARPLPPRSLLLGPQGPARITRKQTARRPGHAKTINGGGSFGPMPNGRCHPGRGRGPGRQAPC